MNIISKKEIPKYVAYLISSHCLKLTQNVAFEFFTVKNSQFWHKNKTWQFLKAFQEFVVFEQKCDFWHTVATLNICTKSSLVCAH